MGLRKTNQRTLEELKGKIRDEININRGELQRVTCNFVKRCQKCMDDEGGEDSSSTSVNKVDKYDNL